MWVNQPSSFLPQQGIQAGKNLVEFGARINSVMQCKVSSNFHHLIYIAPKHNPECMDGAGMVSLMAWEACGVYYTKCIKLEPRYAFGMHS